MTKFQLGFSCFTDDLPFDSRIRSTEEFTVYPVTARCPGSVAAKQTQTPPPPCLTAGMNVNADVLCLVSFKHLHFGLIWSNDIVSEVLSFVQRQLCNKLYVFMLFLIVLSIGQSDLDVC